MLLNQCPPLCISIHVANKARAESPPRTNPNQNAMFMVVDCDAARASSCSLTEVFIAMIAVCLPAK